MKPGAWSGFGEGIAPPATLRACVWIPLCRSVRPPLERGRYYTKAGKFEEALKLVINAKEERAVVEMARQFFAKCERPLLPAPPRTAKRPASHPTSRELASSQRLALSTLQQNRVFMRFAVNTCSRASTRRL